MDITVTCAPAFHIKGTVSGLVGTGLVLQDTLQDNSTDNLSISANGDFTFNTFIANGGTYNVKVLTQPGSPNQNCVIDSNSSGIVNGMDVSNINVACTTNQYTISGKVQGLVGSGLVLQDTLQDNSADDLNVSADGNFTFNTAITDGETYAVSVKTQPTGPAELCAVAYATGRVSGADISNLVVSCTTKAYTIGGSVVGLKGGGLVLQNNSGDDLSISADGGFTFNTVVADGGSYAVTVATQPTSPAQTCEAYTPSGSGVSADVTTVRILCHGDIPRFAYALNGDNTLSIYTLNASTGQLRNHGYVVSTSGSVVVDPSNRFVYVAHVVGSGDISGEVSSYAINPNTGELTSIGTTVKAGSLPYGITVDPSGRFVYVPNYNSNDISVFSIDPVSGALTTGTSVPAGAQPGSVAVDPTGRFAYVANINSDNVSVYSIDPSSGALTTGATVSAGKTPFSITIDPSGKYVYVPNYGSSDVSVFSINVDTGALTLQSSEATAAYPQYITIDPTGRFAYMLNNASNDVSVFSIDSATGGLTAVGIATAGTQPYRVVIDSSGHFVYVPNFGSNDISIFSISSTTGDLTPVSKIRGRYRTARIALSDGTSAANYAPNFAYVANNGSNDVSPYTIDSSTGDLSLNTSIPAGAGPFSITSDLSGKFAYVVNGADNTVSSYTIDASTGVLNAGNTIAAGTGATSITVEPSGRFAYVTDSGSNHVLTYSIDASTGDLSGGASIVAGTEPQSITVDPTGQFVYTANFLSNDVSVYAIDPSTGALTAGTTVTAGTGPRSVTVDPTGQFAYVANLTSNDISIFSIDSGTGALTGASVVSAGTNPVSIDIDPTGQFAYVANYVSNTVSVYNIDTSSGLLSAGKDVSTGTGPQSITVDPSGTFVYVANYLSDDVSIFSIDSGTGALSAVNLSVGAGANPYSVVTIGAIK